jgi:sugar phosphate isomerase/epimerase
MTSAYPYLDLTSVLQEVAKIGGGGLVQEVELCALDPDGDRMKDPNDHVAAHVDTKAFNENPRKEAQRFAEMVNDLELGVTFGNYDFIHTHDPGADEKVLDFTMELIDYAAALGGKNGGAFGVNVGMFFGFDRFSGLQQNLDAVTRKMTVLGKYASERNVIIGSENCHMPGGRPLPFDMYLLPTANRSLGSTLAARTLLQKRLAKFGLAGVLQFTWDASHPETEHNDPLPEAELTFANEDNYQFHIKGHKTNIPEEATRRAWFGGPALPGWYADRDSKLYEEATAAEIPISDNAWGQQYGRVTLPGDGHCITPFPQIIAIARKNGFSGRMTAENETPKKGELVGAQDTTGLSDMYADCHAELKPHIWRGDTYQGKPFKALDIERDGVFRKRMTFRQAAEHYRITV